MTEMPTASCCVTLIAMIETPDLSKGVAMSPLSTLHLRWSVLALILLTGGSLLLSGCQARLFRSDSPGYSDRDSGRGDRDRDGSCTLGMFCDRDSDD